MDVVAFFSSQTLFDIGFFLILLGALVIGFVQGAIRRLIGTVAVLVAFLLAANLRQPVGEYLGSYWTQFPAGYSLMLAFLGLFLGLWLALTVLIQGVYKRSLIHRSEALDEILGAILGLVHAFKIGRAHV